MTDEMRFAVVVVLLLAAWIGYLSIRAWHYRRAINEASTRLAVALPLLARFRRTTPEEQALDDAVIGALVELDCVMGSKTMQGRIRSLDQMGRGALREAMK